MTIGLRWIAISKAPVTRFFDIKKAMKLDYQSPLSLSRTQIPWTLLLARQLFPAATLAETSHTINASTFPSHKTTTPPTAPAANAVVATKQTYLSQKRLTR